MLSPYRVLDLTNERGLLCGQILGDLGADVIKVEPPGGSPARKLGPFFQDQPDPNRSLYWWSYNRNKRSITLRFRGARGANILLRLAKDAHFLIESDSPGQFASLGLGYADLAAINPALIGVSITPFGQDGPKRVTQDSDLVILAAGGPLVLTGDDDRAPVRVSVPQATCTRPLTPRLPRSQRITSAASRDSASTSTCRRNNRSRSQPNPASWQRRSTPISIAARPAE